MTTGDVEHDTWGSMSSIRKHGMNLAKSIRDEAAAMRPKYRFELDHQRQMIALANASPSGEEYLDPIAGISAPESQSLPELLRLRWSHMKAAERRSASSVRPFGLEDHGFVNL
mgnify:CR=1 FL=1